MISLHHELTTKRLFSVPDCHELCITVAISFQNLSGDITQIRAIALENQNSDLTGANTSIMDTVTWMILRGNHIPSGLNLNIQSTSCSDAKSSLWVILSEQKKIWDILWMVKLIMQHSNFDFALKSIRLLVWLKVLKIIHCKIVEFLNLMHQILFWMLNHHHTFWFDKVSGEENRPTFISTEISLLPHLDHCSSTFHWPHTPSEHRSEQITPFAIHWKTNT